MIEFDLGMNALTTFMTFVQLHLWAFETILKLLHPFAIRQLVRTLVGGGRAASIPAPKNWRRLLHSFTLYIKAKYFQPTTFDGPIQHL